MTKRSNWFLSKGLIMAIGMGLPDAALNALAAQDVPVAGLLPALGAIGLSDFSRGKSGLGPRGAWDRLL